MKRPTKNRARAPSPVIVTVSGGVADILRKPVGVEVRIIDYDVDGEDDNRLDRDGAYKGQYHCPHCHRELKLVVPFISVEPYLWQLAHPLPPEIRQPGDPLTEDCEHKVTEDCLICRECGRCRESLDENDVCSECRSAKGGEASSGEDSGGGT